MFHPVLWAWKLVIFEPTCAHARWALMSRLLSVRLCKLTRTKVTRKNVTRKKITRKKIISQQPFNFGSWNLVSTWTWMTPKLTLRVKVIGQGHEVKKRYFRSHSTTLQVIFEVKGHRGQGQRSYGSRSKVDLEGQGQRSRSPGQKFVFMSHLTVLQAMFKVKGHESGSKVTWVKVKGQVL